MAEYDNRGRGTLSDNDRKTEDWHPDMRGSGQWIDGTPIWIDGWRRQSKDGGEFLSIRVRPKDSQAPVRDRQRPQRSNQSLSAEIDDEIPF